MARDSTSTASARRRSASAWATAAVKSAFSSWAITCPRRTTLPSSTTSEVSRPEIRDDTEARVRATT